MDYSNYIKEHPNSLIITNTEEEFVDVGMKLGWTKSNCKEYWERYKDNKPKNRSIICIHSNYMSYSQQEYFTVKNKEDYENFKRISYSEFLGTTDDYQIY